MKKHGDATSVLHSYKTRLPFIHTSFKPHHRFHRQTSEQVKMLVTVEYPPIVRIFVLRPIVLQKTPKTFMFTPLFHHQITTKRLRNHVAIHPKAPLTQHVITQTFYLKKATTGELLFLMLMDFVQTAQEQVNLWTKKLICLLFLTIPAQMPSSSLKPSLIMKYSVQRSYPTVILETSPFDVTGTVMEVGS